MGHIRLGKISRGRRWKQVVELLRTGGSIEELAAETAHAAEREIAAAKNDPVFAQAVWLLTQLPLAARSPDYENRLAALGIAPGAEQSPLALIAAASIAIDRGATKGLVRTDLGELARQAASESLAAFLCSASPGFFNTPADALKQELARLGTKANFAALAREFFARLTLKTIEHYVSRELPNQIGQGKALPSIDRGIAFREALEQHCREAAMIVEAFAGGWYSKANYEGTLDPAAAQRFAAYALTKMHDELRARRAGDG